MGKNGIKLNAGNLSLLPKKVKIPSYDSSKVKAGIVHVGKLAEKATEDKINFRRPDSRRENFRFIFFLFGPNT